MTDPTSRPDGAAAAGTPSPSVPADTPGADSPAQQPPAEAPVADTPAHQPPAAQAHTVQHVIGWCLAGIIGLLACLSLAPDLLGGLSDDLQLSLRYPFAQAIALRSGLVVILALVGLVVAASALTRVLRREGGKRTGVVALVLLLVAGAHSWVLWDRGLETTDLTMPHAVTHTGPDETWDGNLTVLSFNTFGGRANLVELAVLIRQTSPDVVVLPETHAGDAARLLSLLNEDGLSFAPFTAVSPQASSTEGAGDAAAPSAAPTPTPSPSASGFNGDPDATSVLVSVAIGEYEQVTVPDDLGHGAVLLQPVGDPMLNGHQRPTILGVHTIAPLKDTMAPWAQSVRGVVAQCQSPATGLVLAGDLNATADHALMRDLGGCTDAAVQAGAGGLSTWPTRTRTPLLGAAIDHVLVDASTWAGTGVELVEITGSDHRALLVTLAQH